MVGGCRSEKRTETIRDGGQGGKGGNITVSNTSTINSYNGSYITDGSINLDDDNNKVNFQAIIYGQLGYDVAQMRNALKIKNVVSRTAEDLLKEFSSYGAYRIINNDFYSRFQKIGVGSGAGAVEISNGTYTIDESMN